MPFSPNPTPELRSANRAINAENAIVREMRYALDAPEVDKARVIGQWLDWYEERRDRWQYSTRDKLRIFLLETRFATYMGNLFTLDFGVSLVTREPVLETLLSKLPYSLSLSVTSLT